MAFGLLDSIIIVLVIAFVVTAIFRYLKMPVILGYLVVGALVGPNGLGWIPQQENIRLLAEFGIVFLMFTVGLEFSLAKLFALRKAVLLGFVQVALTLGITMGIAIWVGMTTIGALVVGSIAAMSSTALVIKQLSHQLELYENHGLNAVGILLFQDIAVIFLLILISSFGVSEAQTGLTTVFWAIAKSIIAIIFIISLGRWIFTPLFRIIARARSIELFTLTVLLVVLGTAWISHKLGLPYSLGAFFAGIMLGESEFRHQIEVEIRPFRDIFLGLFFITIGMLLNLSTWLDTWQWIVLMLLALLIGKGLLIALLTRCGKDDKITAFRTGIILAQGSEFGFAILTLALSQKILPPDYGQVILSALLLSFAIAPLLIHYNKKLAELFFPITTKRKLGKIKKTLEQATQVLKDHIIICGYGRVGQNIAGLLKQEKIAFCGLDMDAELINNARLAGDTVCFGDAAHYEILKAAGVERAKVLLISFSDNRTAVKIIDQIRKSGNKIPIIARCKDAIELEELQKYGADKVVTEVYEESLTLAHELLRLIRIPESKVDAIMHNIRSHHYELLRRILPGSYAGIQIEKGSAQEQLRPVLLPENAYAVQHTLSEIPFPQSGVHVIALRRGNKQYLKPRGNIKFQPGDIVVLYGDIASLDAIERILLEGT